MRRALVTTGIALAWLVTLAGATSAEQKTLTHADLIRQMIDLEALAVLPPDAERGAMWASTDRRSQYDAEKEQYVQWGANGDGTGCIRREDGTIVMAEMDGPGVLWRIWSARPQNGHVKIYLDGADEPVLDRPFAHYFDAEHPPFDYASLGYVAARGHNLYYPIPYQKSCRIVAEGRWGRYYQFTFATLPEGTTVPTFSPELTDEARKALDEVDTFLRQRLGTDPAGPRKGQQRVEKTITVGPGKTADLLRRDGPAAITAMHVKMDFADRDAQMAALRELVLQIRWDGQDEPAVWCPLGDFFGTAPGVNLYKSLPVGMTEDGFYAYWYMPFARSCAVTVANDGKAARTLEATLCVAPLGRRFEGLGHFHCKWHRDLETLPKDRWPDWLVLRTRGRGRFCGMMLHVWDPRPGWWGEGDEKFFVDGETYPSTFGTGTEDYFGYAWCTPAIFHRPFHNQTMSEGNAGHQSVNRWQIADNVPFHTAFEAALEKYFPNQRPTLYAATAVWYLAPGGEDPIAPTPVEQRHSYYHRPPPGGGGFTCVQHPPGRVRTQRLAHYEDDQWTNDDHLWWTGAKPGDTLQIKLPVEKAGRYDLQVILTKARDYGIVQFALDGEKIGEPVDLYHPTVTRTEPISLGVHALDAGQHVLAVTITGANDKAEKAYMFGLDVIKLVPAP